MLKHLVLSVCLLSHFALAATESTESLTRHEIVIAPMGKFERTSSGVSSIGAAFGYHYSLSNEWQVGLTPSFEYFSIGPIWQAKVMASVTYNLLADKGFLDSPFVTAAAGLLKTGGPLGSSDVVWEATLGKRFNLFQGVNYRPALSV